MHSERPRAIPVLDGWRAIAIALVMLDHIGLRLSTSFTESYSDNVFAFGHIGVPIFFGISGLLITKLLMEDSDQSRRCRFAPFYVRRAFRILPPVLLLLFVISVMGQIKGWREIVASILFVRNYLGSSAGGWYTGHLWSLAVEEHFYLVWPLTLSMVLTMRRPALGIAALASGVAIARAADVRLDWSPMHMPLASSGIRSDLYFDGLIWGCLAGCLLHRGSRLTSLLSAPVCSACLALFVVDIVRGNADMPHWHIAILIAMTLLGTVTHPAWFPCRIMSLPPVRWVGRISYSLYLWQQVFLTPSWVEHRAGGSANLPSSIALCFTCAVLSYYLVEKPSIRYGRSLAFRISNVTHQPPRPGGGTVSLDGMLPILRSAGSGNETLAASVLGSDFPERLLSPKIAERNGRAQMSPDPLVESNP